MIICIEIGFKALKIIQSIRSFQIICLLSFLNSFSLLRFMAYADFMYDRINQLMFLPQLEYLDENLVCYLEKHLCGNEFERVHKLPLILSHSSSCNNTL